MKILSYDNVPDGLKGELNEGGMGRYILFAQEIENQSGNILSLPVTKLVDALLSQESQTFPYGGLKLSKKISLGKINKLGHVGVLLKDDESDELFLLEGVLKNDCIDCGNLEGVTMVI